jgi:hypothetical protein
MSDVKTADESPQNSPVLRFRRRVVGGIMAKSLVPASLRLQILQRHIGWFWGLTPPIQAASAFIQFGETSPHRSIPSPPVASFAGSAKLNVSRRLELAFMLALNETSRYGFRFARNEHGFQQACNFSELRGSAEGSHRPRSA